MGPFKSAVLLLCSAAAVHACTTDDDCSLNGVCSAGVCACDAAWSGADCGVLRLLPTKKNNGYHNTTGHMGSWGGSIHKDPASDAWYMFATEFANHCPLTTWTTNSMVVRTVSKQGPLGPYTFDTVLLPTFHFNPNVQRTADGKYVMFVIGSPNNQTVKCGFEAHVTAPQDMGESGISAFIAPSIDSPFTRVGTGYILGSNPPAMWDADTSNPGPLIHANQSVLMMYRGCSDRPLCKLGLASAPSYRSSNYTRLNGDRPVCGGASPSLCNAKDPFVYQDPRGHYHAMLHNMGPEGGSSGCTPPKDGCLVGSHAYSRDGLSWTFSKTIAYNTTVYYDDGTSEVFDRRERPQLVLENGVPKYLSNGVQPMGAGLSHTIVVPINTA
eukprot:Rhum_TRINITY_DN14892_c0_g1::Rhum_TRINITY_DN14892_c0_g1_i2::g.124955::m.124955